MRSALTTRLLPWAAPLLLLAVWEYAGRHTTSIYLPPASEVARALRDDWMWDHTTQDLLPSLKRFALGYVAGSALGIAVGLAIGSSRRVAQYTGPTLEFLRALPAVAVMPVAILLFGLGDGMRISIIAFGVLFPVLVNTAAGARSCRQERIDVAEMFGLNRIQVVRRVILPSAVPMISAGLRVGLPIALIMMVVSELVGGKNGIGFYLTQAQSLFDIAGMFSALVILGVLGNLINWLYVRVETKQLHWGAHL
ncbi:ABC transporter permease [Nocardioides carbamazepini]|uniref:ABC transporter permease n=1 Tax=Nocardioides carbamazepini TaxID=2854259 RepID=UPI002149A683|nr:ABC transporter permease [Nocardioides carbamazepini]MCR1784390.1 ABC transporter permease [Nocardioides carbamazepini]